MAAAVIVKRARDHERRLRVTSAGIAAFVGQPAPQMVLTLMEHLGFDLSRHKAQQLTGVLAHRHDLLLVMERAQQAFIEHHWPDLKGKVHRLGGWRNEDVADPYGFEAQCYIDCLKRIDLCVADWDRVLWGEDTAAAAERPL